IAPSTGVGHKIDCIPHGIEQGSTAAPAAEDRLYIVHVASARRIGQLNREGASRVAGGCRGYGYVRGGLRPRHGPSRAVDRNPSRVLVSRVASPSPRGMSPSECGLEVEGYVSRGVVAANDVGCGSPVEAAGVTIRRDV